MNNSEKTVLLTLKDKNFKLVQAACKSKFPSVSDWRNKWFRSREALEKYIDENPNTNMAIIPSDDEIVIDIDPRNGGNESFEKIRQDFKPTFKVATGGGGYHYYYKLPQGFKGSLRKCLKGLEGIDVKTSTGCLMAPGSTHPNGNKYRIADDSIDDIVEIHPELLKYAMKENEEQTLQTLTDTKGNEIPRNKNYGLQRQNYKSNHYRNGTGTNPMGFTV